MMAAAGNCMPLRCEEVLDRSHAGEEVRRSLVVARHRETAAGQRRDLEEDMGCAGEAVRRSLAAEEVLRKVGEGMGYVEPEAAVRPSLVEEVERRSLAEDIGPVAGSLGVVVADRIDREEGLLRVLSAGWYIVRDERGNESYGCMVGNLGMT